VAAIDFFKRLLHCRLCIVSCALISLSGLLLSVFCGSSDGADPVVRIHEKVVFVDTHAHPDRFHRANISRISREEIDRYRTSLMDMTVCNISSDAAYQGGYVKRDGTRVKRLKAGEDYEIKPGEAFAFTMDRYERILETAKDDDIVIALSPSFVVEAKKKGKFVLMAALEGADGLEGSVDNLRILYDKGLRLLQLVHFRANELGFIQTKPYKPGGLLPFGEEAVRECNRLGIVIDLAHANNQTIMDVLAVSDHPVIFSHTGVKALSGGDRDLTDEEILAIAEKGGLIGIWPSGSACPTMNDMIKHIDYVKNLAGIDHVCIGSDLRGMSSYTEGFGEEANFKAIAEALLEKEYTEEEVGKVMGGNFFRMWQIISGE